MLSGGVPSKLGTHPAACNLLRPLLLRPAHLRSHWPLSFNTRPTASASAPLHPSFPFPLHLL